MSLAEDYKRQLQWRAWPLALDALPSLHGQTVLDLGCGVGDLAAALAARGARVIGVDNNQELLDAARARGRSSRRTRGTRSWRGATTSAWGASWPPTWSGPASRW